MKKVKVTYNNEDYYVIDNSDDTKDYVTLLKKEPLTYDELITYKGDLSSDYFKLSNGYGYANYYYNSDDCYPLGLNEHNIPDVSTGCSTNYNTSYVKTVIDNWSNNKINSEHLVTVNGYKARLLNVDELLDKLGYDKDYIYTDDVYRLTDSAPSWLYDGHYEYWTMSSVHDSNKVLYYISSDGMIFGFNTSEGCGKSCVYSKNVIRPVINIKKCAIDGTC